MLVVSWQEDLMELQKPYIFLLYYYYYYHFKNNKDMASTIQFPWHFSLVLQELCSLFFPLNCDLLTTLMTNY